MHFFFVELLDIVLFGSATTGLSRGVERIKRFYGCWSLSRCWERQVGNAMHTVVEMSENPERPSAACKHC